MCIRDRMKVGDKVYLVVSTDQIKKLLSVFGHDEKLAKKIAEEQIKVGRNIKIFIQVNLGKEIQKSGTHEHQIKDLVSYCSNINLTFLLFVINLKTQI